MEIFGFCDEKFDLVREEFERNFTDREDVGASFAVTINGEYVIDIWAGYRDAAKSVPWEKNTIVNVFSSTKPMYFLAALMLADRGELDFYDKVTRYWPEYGQNGKEKTEVRHFMSHSAGLPGFGEQLTLPQLCDWEYVVALLERQRPWWAPGIVAHYHALTQGFLVGEIIRRITGKSLGTFFREEIAEPLGADFHIGVDPALFPRTAEMLMVPIWPKGYEKPKPPAIPNELKDQVDGIPDCMPAETNSEIWRRAEVPAGNGHGNARSVARVSSVVANKGIVDGIKLLSKDGVERIFDKQMVMGDLQLGMGYCLNQQRSGAPADSKVCWWGGAGGSTNMMDLTHGVSMSYVMNQMNYDIVNGPRGLGLHRSFYRALKEQ